jgi:site-specific DNA-methyltransferase (adenine-specific)
MYEQIPRITTLPKPYYDEGGITIYMGDCREILPLLPAVDLVLTDPPYNVGIEYGSGTNDNRTREDFIEWAKVWVLECLEKAPTVLISTGHMRLPDYAMIEPWKWLICWWKPAAMGRSPVGFSNWEPVAMWGKGAATGCDFIKAPIVPSGELDGHPCPKPLDWAKCILSLFPNAKTIIDPFVGSGTTIRAAKDLGRKAIGIEIEERYCEIAAKRLAQEVLPL